MAFLDKFKGKSENSSALHNRIADSADFIQAGKGKLEAARDSIAVKKQAVQNLIAEADVLHSAHDELDELKAKFNNLLG